MATQRKKKAKGLPKRTGHRAGKIARYYAGAAVENKLRRVLRHNGVEAAKKWAEDHVMAGAIGVLRELTKG